jgi:pyridoxal phosphate enzyme (YggS family)
MSVSEKLNIIRSKIPANVKLVAVSKTHDPQLIMEAYRAGQRVFGENKVQELTDKYEKLPKDIEWHFIGHLQTNKVKYIAPFVSLIHAADSFKLLRKINNEGKKNDRIINCLLQFHIAEEDSKFGLSYSEAEEILESKEYSEFENVNIKGVMGMATFTDNSEQVSAEFIRLKTIFDKLKIKYFVKNDAFCEISMGMSDDYEIAIDQGSTMIRVGSSIFGQRVYQQVN